MCSTTSVADIGIPLYLYNKDYPSSISSSDTQCSCSVETTDCGSQIDVYFVDFQLAGGDEMCTSASQQLHIQENSNTMTLECFNDTGYSITKKLTSDSNYLTITLENQDKINKGHFWMAFKGKKCNLF